VDTSSQTGRRAKSGRHRRRHGEAEKLTPEKFITEMLIFLLAAVPSVAMSSSDFDGSWMMRTSSVKVSGNPDTFQVSKGVYVCSSCNPPISVSADGIDHSVTGQDYFDSVAVRIVSDRAIERLNKMSGKIAGMNTLRVSADGKTLTNQVAIYQGTQPDKETLTYRRTAPGPAGSHAISGSWMQTSVVGDSAVLKYQSTADGLKMQWNGQSYDAKFDGHEYPIKNDPGNTTVSLERINSIAFEETDRRAGKVVEIIRSTLSADGKSMAIVDIDPVNHTTSTYVMVKQR
jgi:hypothetical protein